MNKNPRMKKASKNLSKILNPKKTPTEILKEKHKKINEEVINSVFA